MKFAVCTTIHEEGYNKYAKKNFELFVKHWPNNIKLYAFMEGEYDTIPGVQYYDLYKQSPDLKKFLEVNKGRKWWPKDREMKIYKRDWIKFCYKSFTMYEASKLIDTDYLIWLDADIITKKDLPINILDALVDPTKFCTYLNRESNRRNKKGHSRKWLSSETGFIIFNLKHHYSKEFFETFIDYYRNGTMFDLHEVHDAYILDTALEKLVQQKKIINIKMTDGIKDFPLNETVLDEYLFHQMGRKKWKS